jgi:hypothetical protein
MPDPIPPANGEQPNNGQAPTPPANGQPQPGGAAPVVLEFEGQKYGIEELKGLLKAKTDYDQLQPEFTRRSQILSSPDKFREFGSKQFPDLFPTQPGQLTDEEKAVEAAKAEARKLGLVSKDEVEKLAEQKMNALLEQREADRFIASELERMSKEWDGTDGKPKFETKAVLEFAAKEGLPIEEAFWKMNRSALLDWHASQKAKAKTKTPVIAAPGGGGSAPVQPDDKLDITKRGAVSGDFKKFMADRNNE